MRGLGTVLNLATVATGGLIGLYAGHRLPDRIRRTVMQAIGLAVLAIAVVGFEPLLDADRGLRRSVILIGSVSVGAVLGELLRLEERLENVGESLKRRFAVDEERELATAETHSPFVEGFVVASTVFCAGPLTILGAVEDGLGTSIRLLAIKSTLDGITVVGFASIYGWGALASLVTIAVYQGGITAAAALVEPLLTDEVLAQLGVVGSLLVLGIGLRLLEIKEIPVVNMLPALLLGPATAAVVDAFV